MIKALIAIIILLAPFAFMGVVSLCKAASNGDKMLTLREREGREQNWEGL